MKFYYIISNTYNEYSSRDVAIRNTYNEAVEKIKDCCDWYCPSGSGTIRKVDGDYHEYECWVFFNNKVKAHYLAGREILRNED